MSQLKVDCAVVGTGVAGFAAALALRRRNKQVAVVARAGGATSLSSGAWDFGPLPEFTGVSLEEVTASPSWQEPYGKVFAKTVPDPAYIRRTAEDIATLFEPGLRLRFSFKRSLCLPTSAGLWKTTFGAQEFQSRADLQNLRGKRVGLVAGRNWRFDAARTAVAWQEGARRAGVPTEISPIWVDLPLPGEDWPLPHLAARLNADNALCLRLRDSLSRALAKGWHDVLLFPPLFLDSALLSWLEKELAVPTAETLCTAEPLAGARLSRAIREALEQHGAIYHGASDIEAISSGERLETLRVRRAPEFAPVDIIAERFVLATGKYLGGGVELGFSIAREPILDLPLFADEKARAIRYRSEICGTEQSFFSEQVWARLGVRVDDCFRPLNEGGQPAWMNLHACGSLLGGIDFAREGLGLGYMALTGRQCGELVP